MLTNKVDELFEKIKEITGIEDIGYHQVMEGKLNPIYKSKTGELSLEEWKAIHAQNPVYIKGDSILQEVVMEKRTVVISDVRAEKRSSSAFFLFGIDSIIVIPVVRKNEVIGIVPIVSIGKIHSFSENDIQKCKELIEYYKEFL